MSVIRRSFQRMCESVAKIQNFARSRSDIIDGFFFISGNDLCLESDLGCNKTLEITPVVFCLQQLTDAGGLSRFKDRLGLLKQTWSSDGSVFDTFAKPGRYFPGCKS